VSHESPAELEEKKRALDEMRGEIDRLGEVIDRLPEGTEKERVARLCARLRDQVNIAMAAKRRPN
jgi:hypothetical protein